MTQLTKNVPEKFDPDNPWKGDKLDRKSVADFLSPVIASIRQPFVIGLHSAYGTGKTDFLKRWGHDLENDGYKVIRFNAWETDFSQDALSAFVSALKRGLEKNDAAKEKFGKLIKKTGVFIGKRGGPLLLKALATKAFSADGTDEIIQSLGLNSEDAAGFLADLATVELKAQETAEQNMESFKILLAEIVADATAKEEEEDTSEESVDGSSAVAEEKGKKNVLIFIDELDRCRPDYAVQVLETIKHFFSVEGVVFVIAIDDKQLRSSIASVYGPKLDADGYLRRFIDWRFNIPEPSAKLFTQYLSNVFDLTSHINSGENFDPNTSLSALEIGFCTFAAATELTLRQQEQAFTRINLYLREIPARDVPFMFCLGMIAALDTWSPTALEDCLHQTPAFSEFFRPLRLKFERFIEDEKLEPRWSALELLAEAYFWRAEDMNTWMGSDSHSGMSAADERLLDVSLHSPVDALMRNRNSGQFVGNSITLAGFVLHRLRRIDQFVAK